MSRPTRPRLILADDSSIILDALDRLLRSDYDVVAVVRDGEQLVEAAGRLRPDVIVTDMNMPKLSGLEALRRLKASGLDVKFVLLTIHGDPAVAAEVFHAGGSAYVVKHSATEELPHAIEEVLLGRTYLTPQIAPDDAAKLAPPDVP